MARNDTLGLWMVSSHDEVVAVSRDPETFCSSKGIMTFEIGAEYPSPPTMMHTDPPDHTRYRTLVQPGFRPELHAGPRAGHPSAGPGPGRPDRGRGRRSTSCAELAVPLPLQVISDLLGVPEEEWPRFFRWSEAVIPGRHRLARGGAGPAERRDGDLPARGRRRPARLARGTTSSASSGRPRSTATG